MPNYCDYVMNVTGKTADVLEFADIMQRDYGHNVTPDSTGKEHYKMPINTHMFRIFEAYVFKENPEIINPSIDLISITMGGYCAWSVASCMTDYPTSYYGDSKKKQELADTGGSCLEEITSKLDIAVEIYSEETGMCFQEHFIYHKGKRIIDECVEYHENYDEATDESNPEGGFKEYGYFTELEFLFEDSKSNNAYEIIIEKRGTDENTSHNRLSWYGEDPGK